MCVCRVACAWRDCACRGCEWEGRGCMGKALWVCKLCGHGRDCVEGGCQGCVAACVCAGGVCRAACVCRRALHACVCGGAAPPLCHSEAG